MNLKHPVHFVAPDSSVWPELKGWDGTPLDDQILSKRSGGILHSWILRTYYQLRVAGETSLSLSSTTRRDAINLVAARELSRRQRDPMCFIVIPQGDAHYSQLANFRIQQNGVRPARDDETVIWHWPQPGIIPRDSRRGTRMEQMCYKGRLLNLDEAFRSDAFLAEVAALGVSFEVDAFDGLRGDHDWNDYAQSDAVLAVRNMTLYDASKKPASKLVNAWFAELPALLGPEPAFRELGTPGEDYIEVRTEHDVLEALTALRDNPDLFRRIVESGKLKGQQCSEPALTQLWIDTLNGPVAEHFEQWQGTSALQRLYHSVRGMMREPGVKAEDSKKVVTGQRLLDAVSADTKSAP